MTKPIARDPMYRRRSFDADIIQLLCALAHHLPAEILRYRGDDGGAWCRDPARDDFTMGRSVRLRVREAMESTCTRSARPRRLRSFCLKKRGSCSSPPLRGKRIVLSESIPAARTSFVSVLRRHFKKSWAQRSHHATRTCDLDRHLRRGL